LLAALAAVGSGRWNFAAAGLGLATFFKVYPLAVGLLLAAVYPRKFGVRLFLALAAGALLPFLLQRPGYVSGQYAAWWEVLRTEDRNDLPLILCYRDLCLLCRVCGVA